MAACENSTVERYLKSKEAHLPARGAMRHLDARIGQLLGSPEQGRRTDLEPVPHEGNVAKNDRMDFRVLARALNGSCELAKDEWRQSGRALFLSVLNVREKHLYLLLFHLARNGFTALSETYYSRPWVGCQTHWPCTLPVSGQEGSASCSSQMQSVYQLRAPTVFG